MNKITIILALVIFSFNAAFSQCNPYYNFKEGKKWEITSYDQKDKKTGKQAYEITSLNENSSGWKATLAFQVYDKKDKETMDKEVDMECKDGTIEMDMTRFIPAEALQSMESMNVKLEMESLDWPANLSVGQKLSDGAIHMKSNMFNMSTRITDRKVESKESITTPAGTFDCFKVTYKIISESIMTIEMYAVDYIAKDVGVVKSESYNSNKKLTGYSLLTSVN
ncbi:TapB family protein [Fulvivirga ligni]|uniref:TapB family protein n=1 Tax=Fulvivirga ligni TaxID=2904246 RepID=UPI001F46C00C|nr:hypothetical protein [Fulvivirga ligni]UII21258.1 hypothetical protein LVD16_25830 [Fulvivirga ligni]